MVRQSRQCLFGLLRVPYISISGKKIPWYESVDLHRQTDKWPLESVKENMQKYLQGYEDFRQMMEKA